LDYGFLTPWTLDFRVLTPPGLWTSGFFQNYLTNDSDIDSGDAGDGDDGGGGGGGSVVLPPPPPPPWRPSAVESDDDDDDDNDYVGEILVCPKRVPSGLAVRPLSSSSSLPLFCLCVPMCLF
jgi:hypothetical protein